MKMIVTRTVTINECHWLAERILEGTVVYRFYGATYGCISHNGTAVTFSEKGDNPFFELPFDALDEYRSIVEA